jgi:hypothetical protein
LESCNDEAVLIAGSSAELELIVEPKYMEEIGLSWAKGSPEKASAPVRIGRGGVFTATRLNRHARTNMEVVSTFLPVRFDTCQESGRTRVKVISRT